MIFIKDPSPKALYLHIPFCVKMCYYCDFNSTVSVSSTIDRYLDAVEREFETLKDRYLFHTVYIGGGTPTVLNESQLERLLDSAIHYGMVSVKTREFTVEANPATVTEAKARLLKDHLVNRISIGVQSFQEKHLKMLGRIHTGDDAKDTFALLRKAGFHNINVDLIFGCPGQTLNNWEKDLEVAIGLNPEHVSTYSLTYEDDTPLARDLQNEVICRLDESVELAMYKTAITCGTNNGYNHYEISNFAKSGYECIHNYFYWKNLSYVGVGAGAFSFINGVRTAHEKNVLNYIGGILGNKDTTAFRERLPDVQSAAETVVMSLRLRKGISNADFYERFGCRIDDRFGDQIGNLSREGLVSYEDEHLRLTEKGLFVADTVMAEFL